MMTSSWPPPGSTVSCFDGVVEAGINGTLLLVNDGSGLAFQQLEVAAFIDVFAPAGVIEAHGTGNLLITAAGLQNLSFSAYGIFLGFEFGSPSNPAIVVDINRHGCMDIGLLGGSVEIALPGGSCSPTPAEPMQMFVDDFQVNEGQGNGTTTALVPIRFEQPATSAVPFSIDLEYWTLSRSEDTATGDSGIIAPGADYLQETQRSFTVDAVPFGIAFRIPDQVFLPVTIFADPLLEPNETFVTYVSGPVNRGAGDDGISEVTIVNDDIEIDPPADSVVFYDFRAL